MANPQHYQPLSLALHQPSAHPSAALYASSSSTGAPPPNHILPREEEEEEEEEDEAEDDEVGTEDQLGERDPDAASPASLHQKETIDNLSYPYPHQQSHSAPVLGRRRIQHEDDGLEPDRKRRPGRPRGSKNRTQRSVGRGTQGGKSTPSVAPMHPHPDINPYNQQYYKFQWEILHLCADFYTAAERILEETSPLVIAQCYQVGSGNKVDPLVMINEAKRICDTLLGDPSQLITNPPPPIYAISSAPPYYTSYSTTASQLAVPQATTTPARAASVAPASSAVASRNKATTPPPGPSASTQPVYVSLPPHAGYPHTQYSTVYSNQYPTASYYQYHYPTTASAYYSHAPTQPAVPPQSSTTVSTLAAFTNSAKVAPGIGHGPESSGSATTMTGAGNQGTWSDEETERLKKLAEDSKVVGPSGEIEWDWVVHQWGGGRSRHQILIKATSLGLKGSSTRGTKRRRGDPETGSISISNRVPCTSAGSGSGPGSAGESVSDGPSPGPSGPAHSNGDGVPASANTSAHVHAHASITTAHTGCFPVSTGTATTSSAPTPPLPRHHSVSTSSASAAPSPALQNLPRPISLQVQTQHQHQQQQQPTPSSSSTTSSPLMQQRDREGGQRQLLPLPPPVKPAETSWPMPAVPASSGGVCLPTGVSGNLTGSATGTGTPTTTMTSSTPTSAASKVGTPMGTTISYQHDLNQQPQATSYYRKRQTIGFVYERMKENGK